MQTRNEVMNHRIVKESDDKKQLMQGFAMLGIGKVGWVIKESPKAGPYDAIVKPLAFTPCTSDIHTVYEGALGEKSDIVLGHEAVGEVVEVGEKVEDFKSGDRVVVPAITPDWRSKAVQRGNPQHSGGMLAGWKFSNIKDGVFAEYFHVNDADMNMAHMPDELSIEAAAILPDMMPTGLHGAELANIELGDSVLVMGIGPVGLMGVVGAKLRGAGRIFAVGSRQVCVDVAHDYGATDIINYKEAPVEEQIMELTDGAGVDRVIVAGGNEDAISTAISSVRPGGTVSNINYFGQGETIPLPRLDWGCGMAHKEIRGGLVPGGRLAMERMINLVVSGRVNPEKLITHKFHGLDKIEDAFFLMKDKPRELIKPVVICDE